MIDSVKEGFDRLVQDQKMIEFAALAHRSSFVSSCFYSHSIFFPVSSTVVAKTISAQTRGGGGSSIAIIFVASYGCFMARRQTCKTKVTNLSMS